uniref:ATP synthase subunit a n=1 Tax=Pontoscolex corethrurus TaxID=195581 RepID=A0A1W5LJT7_9ANNE|nr:ATP synthase F0 subunit 6 [Pontoscolex corethrurus]ANJ60058.1 ATP synthase F0 subunit 6 [Pontoscolex corethrurus]
MMMDIFSSFDPYVTNSAFPLNSMFMTTNLFILLTIQSTFWLASSRKDSYITTCTSLMFTQLSRTNMIHIKGLNLLVTTLFLTLIFTNLLGLTPYMFSTSSHLIMTLNMGLPIWLTMILSSFSLSMKKSIAHLLPDGAPNWLNPFLVIIETTSIMVRPLTLSFRLAANMSAGHIVLGLVGIYLASAWFNSIYSILLLTLTSTLYTLFEVAICLIQAYIFCLLLTLYSDDHSH